MSRPGFQGRLVLITGASEGIGRAAARAFVAQGARVVAVARSLDRLDALASELGGPSRVLAVPADVADGPSMEAMAARVTAEAGVPDVVVANAGIGLDALFTETTDDALRHLLEVNLLGVVRTVRPFLPSMIRRRSGRVLIVSSVVGKRGIPHYAGYAASKFALHGLLDALRPELAGTGVSAGILCPSSTTTEFVDRMRRDGPSQKRIRPRRHPPESVAGAIVAMAASRRRERVLTLEGKLMVWANAVAPGMVDRILARVLTRRRTREDGQPAR